MFTPESESCSVMSDTLWPHRPYHGILQARILEWVAFPFSSGYSQPRNQTRSPALEAIHLSYPFPIWPLSIYLDSWTENFRFLCNIVFYNTGLYFHHQSHPQLGVVFTLALSFCSFWSYFFILLQQPLGHLPTRGVHLSVSYLFAFSYCSWASQGNNTEVFAIPFSSGPRFVRTFHRDPSILGGPTRYGS